LNQILKSENIHDYDQQLQGPNHKIIIPTVIHTGYEAIKSQASLYRPVTKNGDPRIWFYKMTKIAEANDTTMDKILENNGRSVPVGRYGTSEEVAAVIAFLCTNAAAYVNGVSLEVDGGSGAHI
jgi:NAD(P)-dependent dehydrogenase (short-subunit alcohol dehydrogenase family)